MDRKKSGERKKESESWDHNARTRLGFQDLGQGQGSFYGSPPLGSRSPRCSSSRGRADANVQHQTDATGGGQPHQGVSKIEACP
ncbi:hypothetical protein SKAU_G00277790 [Synaphobranchus kaupii]|uniref:Uncharacterized protein n=1 Tax=Synaphobranchus kaupii TaxID=118154 RepID=A0A9Q1EWL5_SYNKA|nr:hypothetical protein SKAU_G00277790 [Synaphobranchus kaupii]